eukprot:m.450509 g.450509  ORF g.450509 m.450509 type:complete len:398 (-) comp21512_c0_seq25:518-1711(-)
MVECSCLHEASAGETLRFSCQSYIELNHAVCLTELRRENANNCRNGLIKQMSQFLGGCHCEWCQDYQTRVFAPNFCLFFSFVSMLGCVVCVETIGERVAHVNVCGLTEDAVRLCGRGHTFDAALLRCSTYTSRLRQDKVQLKSRLENADKRAAYSEHQLRHLRRILAQLVPGTPWDGTPSSLELPPAKRNDLRAIVAALPDLWETQKFRMPATGEVASSSNASISRNPDTADVVHCTTAESSVPAAIMQPSSPHGLSPRKLSPEGFSGNADRPCTTAQPLTPNIRHHATASPGHAAGTASVRHGGGAEDCNEDPPSTGGGPREQHKEQASHPGRGSHHESPSPSASGGSMTHAGTKNRTPRGRGGSTGSSAGSSMSMEDLLRMQDKVIDALQSSQLS